MLTNPAPSPIRSPSITRTMAISIKVSPSFPLGFDRFSKIHHPKLGFSEIYFKDMNYNLSRTKIGLFKKCLCAYPLLSPRGVSRGVPRRLHASGRQKGKCASGRHGWAVAPSPLFVAPNEARGAHGGASLSLGRTKKGCSAGQRKDAWQEGARDFFETALGLKFGLAIIFFLDERASSRLPLQRVTVDPLFLPLIALDNDYSPLLSLL